MRVVNAFLADLMAYQFLQYAFLTGLLAGLAVGVIGSFVVVRRISYIAGGISHTVLGGMGAALFLQRSVGWQAVHPLHGAAAGALLAALIIGLVSLRAQQREDTVIGAVWAVGMAIGVLFISQTPGYTTDLMSYLFGNILLVSPDDVWLLACLDLLIIGSVLVFYNKFVAVCFDGDFARLRGLNVDFYYLFLLCLTALTVVVLVTIVGLVMVIALLTLPPAIASIFSKSLPRMMLWSSLLCMAFTTGGLAVSYEPDLPAGATTVVLAGLSYILVLAGERLLTRTRSH
jgi:zinc transport system permease protein